jgi:hypothetical protein
LFSWAEFTAHLKDFRNPFVVVELFPKDIPLSNYVYRPKAESSAFVGDDELDPLASQKSQADADGGAFPEFGESFKFSFKPPKLAESPVVFTEIANMTVDGARKYIVVIVRRALNNKGDHTSAFLFLTAYDSRSATEFQCGAIEGSALADALYAAGGAKDLEALIPLLSSAADKGELILGPPITPRVVVSVYNQRGKAEDSVGSCELSISSVLASSGINKPKWISLLRDGAQAVVGDVLLDISFRRSKDIEDEMAAKESLQKRKLAVGSATTVLQSISGDRTLPSVGADAGSAIISTAGLDATTMATAVEKSQADKALPKPSPAPMISRQASAKQQSTANLLRQTSQKGDQLIQPTNSAEVQALSAEVTKLKLEIEALQRAKDEAALSARVERRPSQQNTLKQTLSATTAPASVSFHDDESLEGLVRRIRETLQSRGDSDLSGLSRLLRGSAENDQLSAVDLHQCCKDLLINLSLANCEVIVRHVGVNDKRKVGLKALTSFLVNAAIVSKPSTGVTEPPLTVDTSKPRGLTKTPVSSAMMTPGTPEVSLLFHNNNSYAYYVTAYTCRQISRHR